MPRKKETGPIQNEFTVAIDNNEQLPYSLEGIRPDEENGMDLTKVWMVCFFQGRKEEDAPYSFDGILTDAKQGYRQLIIPTVKKSLETGDYSIAGMESRITVERKSLSDLFSTLTWGRERFSREVERMDAMEHAAIVVEGSWEDVFLRPPSNVNPKTIHRTVISWSMKHRAHWHFVGNRRLAEITTFRILEWFWRRDRSDDRSRKHL